MTISITGRYEDFSRVADAALQMTAAQKGTKIGTADRKAILHVITRLPPHPDVADALERLQESGARVAALTNSTEKVAKKQLAGGGIDHYFEKILSVDSVRRYKPAREAYEHAARELRVDAADILLVAAHAWDIAGAIAAGCRAAFVQRPGKSLNPLGKKAEIVAKDLSALVRKIERYGRAG